MMLGRYRIEAKLGEGAMAEVYRASDPEIGRAVAVKVLKQELSRDQQLVARFVREARAAGALSHANIATIYDVGQVDGQPYIAMELVEGRPLDTVLHSQGRMAYERVLELAHQLAQALHYAHAAGVIHRDIKPSNILISSDGLTAKLVDFGVARIGESDALAKTQAGQLIGTPRYMSPEQALGLPVDHRSDLFSLGAVLYEMVTGKVAFPGAGLATLAIQIAQEKVDPIGKIAGDCPSGMRYIIEKLLGKKPEQRFSDGGALATALKREIHAVHEPAPTRRGLPLRLKLPLALVVVTALALFASIQTIGQRQEQELERMANLSGNSISAFVTGNAAVVAADNAGLPAHQQDWTSLQAFVTTAAEDEGVEGIVVADVNGIVRAASNPNRVGSRYGAAPPTPHVKQAPTWTFRADPQSGSRFVRPIKYAGAEFGTVDIVIDRAALDEAISTSNLLLKALALIVMLTVMVVGYLSGAMVTEPLKRLRDALDDAARDGFALRISHRRHDEFGEAFDAFNRAAAEAQDAIGADGKAGDEASLNVTRIAA